MDNLGEKIKKLRNDFGLTQEQLAEKLSVNRATLASWEINRATPDIDTFKQIAIFFNVSLDFLIGNSVSTLTEVLPEIDEFNKKLASLPKSKRDQIIKLGNDLYEILIREGDKN